NKTKIKLEQQRQKEFFNRQRLKKVHKFLKCEPKRARTLPNIEVVRQNGDNHQTNSLTEEINRSSNDDQRLLSLSALNHSKDLAGILCEDKSNILHETYLEPVNLNHEIVNNSTTVSQNMTDILKRKQDLLQGFDWIGVNVSSSINTTNDATFSANSRSQSWFINRQRSKEPSTHNLKHLDSLSLSTKLSKKRQEDDIQDIHETMTTADIATMIDSMLPLEQTNTSESSISEESLEWHHFLANDESNSKICKISESSADINSNIIPKANQSPISTSRTIETSALHSIVSQSIDSTNIAWNNFTHSNDVISNVDLVTEGDNEIFNSSLEAINSPKLSSKKVFANKKCKRSKFDEFAEDSINNESNLEDSGYVKDEKFNYNQDVLISQVSEFINIGSSNSFVTTFEGSLKNARLQLEISFLKHDMKSLMEITKNSGNSSMNQDDSIEFYKTSQTKEHTPSMSPNLECQPSVNDKKHFMNELSQDGISKDSTNMPFALVDTSSTDHVNICQSSIPINNDTSPAESPTLRYSTNFNSWETSHPDMYLFDALDDDDDRKKGHCYPKIFIAAEYFQEVLEGQEIPAGLHVKIDLTTGKKHAKLLDNNNHESSEIIIVDKDGSVHSDLVQTEPSEVDNNQDSQIFIHHEDSLETNNSLPIIPSGHKENNRISLSDSLIFEDCISNLTITLQQLQPLNDIISTLDNLEDLVHELDFGIKLAKGNGLISIVKLLEHDSNEIRKKAALVIGTAMQNNPLAQDEALKLDLIPYLLDLLSSETDIKVSSRLLYALSSIVRGNQESIQSIKNNQGLSRLAIVYQELENNEFRAKCALFVTDFIDPNMVKVVNKKFNTLFDDMGNDKGIDFDTREKILRGISMIEKQYSNQCPVQNRFKNWLLNQINLENDDYLEDYFNL
ncbi:4115_t:CDS:10, partial [Scutellospora calospora]